MLGECFDGDFCMLTDICIDGVCVFGEVNFDFICFGC